MKIREINDYIINRFFNSRRVWFNDCLLSALDELYGLDEFDALEQAEEVEEPVKNCLRNHMDNCRRRGIPPIIRLSDNEVIGRQRPKIMIELQQIIRRIDPFECQRLGCLYVKNGMGYSVHTVKRRDKGADVIAKRDIALVAQARRHIKKDVGRDELDQWLRKVGQHYLGATFVFISATQYTVPARRYADSVLLTLVNGEQIAYFLSKKGFLPSNIRDWLNNECQICPIPKSKCELKPVP